MALPRFSRSPVGTKLCLSPRNAPPAHGPQRGTQPPASGPQLQVSLFLIFLLNFTHVFLKTSPSLEPVGRERLEKLCPRTKMCPMSRLVTVGQGRAGGRATGVSRVHGEAREH